MSNILQKFRDAHYFQMSSQGNIYTLTNLQLANGTNKILAASLKRDVYFLECADNYNDLVIPATKEVLFTYIPGMVEIISIDSFNKSTTENDFVIGITITKIGNEQIREHYLNIYSAWESNLDFNIESISQNCLNVELYFIPYHLYHAKLFTWDNDNVKSETVWLLSGSDEEIHVYREFSINHCYKEIELKSHFPEFKKPPSIVMWMDVQYIENDTKRLSSYGCECGYIYFAIVDVRTLTILNTYLTRFENTITTVRIFTDEPNLRNNRLNKKDDGAKIYHLLVINTLLASVVFTNILQNGLNDMQVLEGSDEFNVTSCGCVADIDLDGRNEILIGKYGEELLAYKFHNTEGWQIEGIKSFPSPVHAILYVDVTGDGVKELIVSTLKRVHILQHDPDDALEKLQNKLKMLNLEINVYEKSLDVDK